MANQSGTEKKRKNLLQRLRENFSGLSPRTREQLTALDEQERKDEDTKKEQERKRKERQRNQIGHTGTLLNPGTSGPRTFTPRQKSLLSN